MEDHPIIDDVGSFPLPEYANKETFEKLYWDVYSGILKGIDVSRNRTVQRYVLQPIEDSLSKKIESGLEVINYPQHMDIWTQFLKPIEDYEEELYLIDKNKAKVIEMELIKDYAKDFYEKTGNKLKLKSCITGPLELYLKKNGFSVYKDMALNFAKSVNAFAKSSIYNEKYIETSVISIDEPSIGYVTFGQVNQDDLVEILDVAAEGLNADIQIHLHSLNQYQLALSSKNINIMTCEYASNQKNVIPKKDLEAYDKFIRVGVARTNLSSIISEEVDKGRDSRELNEDKGLMSIIDSPDRIKKRYHEALDRYGERLKYVGPDCGLKSWGSPKVAFEHLKRTVNTIINER